MTDNLTLDWIISTLKKSGINSKQVVIDKLENITTDELFEISNGCLKVISKRIDDKWKKENESKLEPRD